MLLVGERDCDPPIDPGLSADVPPIVVDPNMPVVPVPREPMFVFENCPQALDAPAAITTMIAKIERDIRMEHLLGSVLRLLPVSTIPLPK